MAKHKRVQWIQAQDFEEIFKNSKIKSPPSLKFDTSYGWPSFSITFGAKEDMEFAKSNGLIVQFKEIIKTYYEKKFDPDRAVFYSYVGYVSPWKAKQNDIDTKTNGTQDANNFLEANSGALTFTQAHEW